MLIQELLPFRVKKKVSLFESYWLFDNTLQTRAAFIGSSEGRCCFLSRRALGSDCLKSCFSLAGIKMADPSEWRDYAVRFFYDFSRPDFPELLEVPEDVVISDFGGSALLLLLLLVLGK